MHATLFAERHKEGSPIEELTCARCGGKVKRAMAYFVRIVLVNAGSSAPREHVDQERPYHQGCAAWLFNAARGKEPREGHDNEGSNDVQ